MSSLPAFRSYRLSRVTRRTRSARRWRIGFLISTAFLCAVDQASGASPCDTATPSNQCGWFDAGSLPPFAQDAILSKGGTIGAGNVLVLTSGDPADPDSEISNDLAQNGCGSNPDGWQTYDCLLLDMFVPPQDSVVLALSSEWFEWYQSIFTDWMTIAGAGVATVDVSINSWINNKVDIIPYGPMDTGVVILTSLANSKMVNFRVADSGDHIYDTAILVVPASWFSTVGATDGDPTLLCGNGTLEPGEDCDDGNAIADDDCNTLCIGIQPPGPAGTSMTCGNLNYVWPTGATSPYTCGNDLCAGFRCVVGNTISPACYAADQCGVACAGACVDVQVAQLACDQMCTVQPPSSEPPPPLPDTCASLVYAWPDGATMPYSCADDCVGQRCVVGSTISPTCYATGQCDATSCPDGTCVDTPSGDCPGLCALGELPDTCTLLEVGQTRPAANQNGPCYGNVEICKLVGVDTLWKIADGYWQPDDEICNGADDDCNGVADDMYVTCGDPGLCQNTVNTCDPSNPTVPVVCVTLPQPSPFEICNDGLDNDCEGAVDDGCFCGDDECMPGESFADCPEDCLPPPDGTACDDDDLCTLGDSYQGGVCIAGAPVTCDSGNACLIDGVCDPLDGCSATKVDCDDHIACTTDSCDSVLGCIHAPVDSACDDTDACNGTEACDVAVGCLAGTPLACDDSDACNGIETCDSVTGCQPGTPLACGDGDACNGVETCDAMTGCLPGVALVCDDGNPCTQDGCDSASGCVVAEVPAPVCANTAPASSILSLRNDADPKRNKVQFKWNRGSFPAADLGDPTIATDYTLCVYDGAGLVVGLTVPAGAALCGTKPCWSLNGTPTTGAKYKDGRKPPVNDGVKSVIVRADTSGRGKLQVKATGTTVPPIGLGAGLTFPVTAQVVTTDAGCWQTSFSLADERNNDGTIFKAKRVVP